MSLQLGVPASITYIKNISNPYNNKKAQKKHPPYVPPSFRWRTARSNACRLLLFSRICQPPIHPLFRKDRSIAQPARASDIPGSFLSPPCSAASYHVLPTPRNGGIFEKPCTADDAYWATIRTGRTISIDYPAQRHIPLIRYCTLHPVCDAHVSIAFAFTNYHEGTEVVRPRCWAYTVPVYRHNYWRRRCVICFIFA